MFRFLSALNSPKVKLIDQKQLNTFPRLTQQQGSSLRGQSPEALGLRAGGFSNLLFLSIPADRNVRAPLITET